VKPKPAQEHWYRVAICLHEFGQLLVAPRLQILEIFRVIGAEPHHHIKVADRGGDCYVRFFIKIWTITKWDVFLRQCRKRITYKQENWKTIKGSQ